MTLPRNSASVLGQFGQERPLELRQPFWMRWQSVGFRRACGQGLHDRLVSHASLLQDPPSFCQGLLDAKDRSMLTDAHRLADLPAALATQAVSQNLLQFRPPF
jgi:hypothetical protein